MPILTNCLFPSTQVSIPDTPTQCDPNTIDASLFCIPENTSAFFFRGAGGASSLRHCVDIGCIDVVPHLAAQTVGHETLGQARSHAWILGQYRFQLGAPVELGAVGQVPAGIDHLAVIRVAPCADGVVVLQSEADRTHGAVAGG